MTKSGDHADRRRHLGVDPVTGRYHPLEEQAALRLEQRVGALHRDPTDTADWIDAQVLNVAEEKNNYPSMVKKQKRFNS